MGASGRAELARAAMAAIGPLVELLLEIGVTSPETESLVRSLFIHKARTWLAAKASGKEPSDARVALVTGVHRNMVRRNLSEPPQVAPARERRGYLAGRVVHAWHTLAPYRNASGQPRDLPEKGPEPSFVTLVAQSLPRAAPGVVLQELMRAGIVESLAEHRVRVRTRTAREPGITLENVKGYGLEAEAVLTTLTRKLCAPHNSPYFDRTPTISVDATRMAMTREIIRRRSDSFLMALEQELSADTKGGARGRSKKVKLAIGVVETLDLKGYRRSRRGERG